MTPSPKLPLIDSIRRMFNVDGYGVEDIAVRLDLPVAHVWAVVFPDKERAVPMETIEARNAR